MRRSLIALATVLTPTGGAPALAQVVSEVHFPSGKFGTMVSGTITGREYADYRLGAEAGQEMFVSLVVAESTGTGTAYFNVLPPGSTGEAIYNGSLDGTETTLRLAESGTYTIRVYQMGNDRDSDQTTGFNIDLSIQ